MRTNTIVALAAAMMVNLSTAQTPPNYEPASSTLLPVMYGNQTVKPGTNFPQPALLSKPSIPNAPSPALVIMLDLDAPLASANRSFSPLCHWIQTTTSEPVTYIPPQPPAGSADHRYVLLGYTLGNNSAVPFTMPKGFENTNGTLEGRVAFNLSGFEKAAGVTGPVAANWFTVSAEKVRGSNGTTAPQFEGRGVHQLTTPIAGSLLTVGRGIPGGGFQCYERRSLGKDKEDLKTVLLKNLDTLTQRNWTADERAQLPAYISIFVEEQQETFCITDGEKRRAMMEAWVAVAT
ncbi:hypothetical protein DM02DRAFT_652150 [Periconia macrospinosa]|uniref:PEBP-like protein n=1 Tax=Periconia macrospinosa TaxID=97972 RepID=A0A2V1E3A1_9PLEO|nr:hypothetical protein DM02DRAFT_652150 [Periconia macrospinosa]